ncbi:hypothetical protein [Amycolatopsis magusensis]|uniref:SPFH domain / Band 7 family protein n=1 Tax=Amycolatopsis magusensis TaxID=882444 RepID=A0ABS4PYQ8_9PSEU|nr:hypothetical protein [Amycolatopsis magusensis]MBP2184570.1 hypothetical protein [Amycolatopsis magusensis]
MSEQRLEEDTEQPEDSTEEKQERSKVVERVQQPDPSWRDAMGQYGNPAIRTLEASVYTPIVGDGRISRLNFMRKRPAMRPWVARVFVQGSGKLVSFSRDKQPTAGELLWGAYHTLYEVDLSLRQLSLEITLPSLGDAFVFRAEVDIQWRVTKPNLVVAKGIEDIRPVLIPDLLGALRQSSRALEAAAVETAERAVNDRIDGAWWEAEYGLRTKVFVRLRMDEQKERNVRLAAEVQAFKQLIAEGDLDQFALQLAQNPQQVESVVHALVQERDTHRLQVFDFITRLIESDALDRWQIDDQVRVMMHWMQASISRVLTGTDTARPLPFEDRLTEGPPPTQNGSRPHANGARGT